MTLCVHAFVCMYMYVRVWVRGHVWVPWCVRVFVRYHIYIPMFAIGYVLMYKGVFNIDPIKKLKSTQCCHRQFWLIQPTLMFLKLLLLQCITWGWIMNQNFSLVAISSRDKWNILKQMAAAIIDRYVLIDSWITKLSLHSCLIQLMLTSVSHTETENCYAVPHHLRLLKIPSHPPNKKRKLPSYEKPTLTFLCCRKDCLWWCSGVLKCSSKWWFLLELRMRSMEGDGSVCWRVMPLYFVYGGRMLLRLFTALYACFTLSARKIALV